MTAGVGALRREKRLRGMWTCALAMLLGTASPAFAQVAGDGTTATHVAVNPDGSVTVGIAPVVNDGISHNRYRDFNVAPPGVKLDNRDAAARTIVNEVTGTSRTDIAGPLEVLGQRAHVIVANPNGITVDKGRFINTGRVALTTGTIGTAQQQIAPGIFQDNVTASVRGGTITIEGGGLSGQMDHVDLIANEIRVNGPITNDSSDERAGVSLYAGASDVTFDSSVLPFNTILDWSRVTGAGATSEGAILVEITRQGVLRGNRIGIEVSDAGAGVRFAGAGFATSRSFTLSADGRVDVTGGQISSELETRVQGRDIALTDAALTGGAAQTRLTATGDLSVTRSRVETGAVAMSSGGGLLLDQATLNTFGDIAITSGAQLTFAQSTLGSRAGDVSLNAAGLLGLTGSTVTSFGNLRATAGDASLAAGDEAAASALVASNGALVMTTRGALTLDQSSLQGGQPVAGVSNAAGTASRGALTLDIGGDMSLASGETLAFVFGQGGDVDLRVGGGLTNTRGRVLANGDIRVETGGALLNVTDAEARARAPETREVASQSGRLWWTLFLRRERSSDVVFDYGILAQPDRLATMTATGGMTLTAGGALRNIGGELNANGGDLVLAAREIETSALGSGRVEARKTCVFRCLYEGGGAVSFHGGGLNAAGNLTMDAGAHFLNHGGQVFALGSVDITADDVTTQAVELPSLVQRPEGLYNFWGTRAAWVFLADQFGTIVADTGKLSITSKRPVRIIGGRLDSGEAVDLSAGQDIVRAPGTRSSALSHSIGLLAGPDTGMP